MKGLSNLPKLVKEVRGKSNFKPEGLVPEHTLNCCVIMMERCSSRERR